MKLGLEGKKALVTGGGRGIGRSSAVCLAGEGARVAVVSRTASDIENTVKEMGGAEAGHCGVARDMTEDRAPSRLVQQLRDAGFFPVDIVVHNLGGTLNITDPFCSAEDWRKVWRFNLEVAVELNLLLVPAMRENRWGRIVHVSSIAGAENQGPVTYCTVKAALIAYTRSLGRVLAPDGIVVTAVLPGAVLTEKGYWDTASRERPDHVKKYLSERMALGRFGTPEEISNAIAFLCSEHASFFVGSIVPVDGGQGRTFFGA